MIDRQLEFIERCCELADGTAVGDGAFAAGPALWVGRREVAHFDDEHRVDVRLTKSVIRRRLSELKGDQRVSLRRSMSDWLELTIESDDDVQWATSMVLDAVAANLPNRDARTSPAGESLERRRRLH